MFADEATENVMKNGSNLGPVSGYLSAKGTCNELKVVFLLLMEIEKRFN